jgi:hypothetical protein
VVTNAFEKAFVTCFDHQQELRRFLDTFGFFEHGRTQDGELVLVKRFDPTHNERQQIAPLDFHIRFGPHNISLSGVAVYVVPIQPQYHAALFRDLERQRSFLAGETVFGNAILKAYLCNASVKTIAPGSVLLFYRSQDACSIRSVGVVDACTRSSDPAEIVRFVGQRTVYSIDQIEQMCRGGTLAILFRQSRTLPSVKLNDLIENNVLRAAPQTITTIRPEGMAWMRQLIEA